MSRRRATWVLAVTLVSGLGACGGGGTAPTGPAADGADLFARTVLGDNAGCTTCHSLEPDVVLVGPSLSGIATTAARRVPGQAPAEYIRESILQPDSYVVPGFDAGRMPGDWGDQLSPSEIDNLVSYLMAVGAEP